MLNTNVLSLWQAPSKQQSILNEQLTALRHFLRIRFMSIGGHVFNISSLSDTIFMNTDPTRQRQRTYFLEILLTMRPVIAQVNKLNSLLLAGYVLPKKAEK